MYYDTQTLKYDEPNQAVKVWVKTEDLKGQKTSERLILISYRDKTETSLQNYFFKMDILICITWVKLIPMLYILIVQ